MASNSPHRVPWGCPGVLMREIGPLMAVMVVPLVWYGPLLPERPTLGKVIVKRSGFRKGKKRSKPKKKLRRRTLPYAPSSVMAKLGVRLTREEKKQKRKKRAANLHIEKRKGMHIQPDGRTRGEMRRERAERRRLRLEGKKPHSNRPYTKNEDPNKPFDHAKRRLRRQKLRERRRSKKMGLESKFYMNETFFNVEFEPGPIGIVFVGQKLTSVAPGSQAKNLGLKRHMRIVAVNGTKARTQKLLDKLLTICKSQNTSYEVTILHRVRLPRVTEEEAERQRIDLDQQEKAFLAKLGLKPKLESNGKQDDDNSVIEEGEDSAGDKQRKQLQLDPHLRGGMDYGWDGGSQAENYGVNRELNLDASDIPLYGIDSAMVGRVTAADWDQAIQRG
ncbi:hypothetical protein AAMO2058_000507300 [Amorphochlora amoebiformis]